MDKKQIIVSTIAGLAVIAIGYLVWRHEQAVSAQNSAAQSDAAQSQVDQLESAIASLPTPSYGGGASSASYYPSNSSTATDDGSTSLQTPASSSQDLEDILNHFFGTTQQPTVTPPNNTTPPASTTPPVDTTTPTQGYTPPAELTQAGADQILGISPNTPTTVILPTTDPNPVASPIQVPISSSPVSGTIHDMHRSGNQIAQSI